MGIIGELFCLFENGLIGLVEDLVEVFFVWGFDFETKLVWGFVVDGGEFNGGIWVVVCDGLEVELV